MRFAIIAFFAFIGMELFSYLVHRFVYHGVAWSIHRSHHMPRKGAFELNDVFPASFATMTLIILLAALSEPVNRDLLALGLGITAYGIVYFLVHDLYVHRRIKQFSFRIPFLRTVKQAHAVHHRYGGEPFGLLFFANPKKAALEHLDDSEVV